MKTPTLQVKPTRAKCISLLICISLGVSIGCSEDTPEGSSSCERSETLVQCSYESLAVDGLVSERWVHFATPTGFPPTGGWPTVLLFSGSLFPSETYFEGNRKIWDVFYHQADVTASLLDAGFAVMAPESKGGGYTFWDTNIPPFASYWEISPDHAFMLELFTEIEEGTFGDLDPSRLHAAGISSGGYMTSRVAIAYPDRFRSLAIQSASYATCGGPICDVAEELPENHPPTLLLHGALDAVVPAYTSSFYFDRLGSHHIPVRRVLDEKAHHGWFENSAPEIVRWFLVYR